MDQPPSAGDGGNDSVGPYNHKLVTRSTSLAIALGSALLATVGTLLVLWFSGTFEREEVRVTEIVEIREMVQVPATEASAEPVPIATAPINSQLEAGEAAPPAATTVPVLPSTHLVSDVASRAIPSIVTVQSLNEEFGFAGSGSGVVVRSDGFIVTNDHVVDGADTLKVIMADGLHYPAELVGTDPLMDLAVLKLETDGLVPIEFGSMEGLRTGEQAIAVGNPLGLDGGPSVTVGVISAFNRTLVTEFGTGVALYGLLQTDAPITRGSSGGALLDIHGRLLGITTAIGLSDVGAEGLGFAVPVNLVERVVDDLMSAGEVRHAFLGIQGSSAFEDLENGVESPAGVEIVSLLEDSAIGEAGAEGGDVIVALNGEPVRSMPLLIALLREYRAEDRMTVTLRRDGETLDIQMTLDMYPS
ncbi:MAG: trypsin-like peptidase domain-containing protein [bacterium]|nr:trypsin-like peptidase domain-containing protein [bacterium]